MGEPDLGGYDGGSLFGIDFFISSASEGGDVLCAFGDVDHTLLYTVALAYCTSSIYRVGISDTLKDSVSSVVRTQPVWLLRWDRPEEAPLLERFEISKAVEWALFTEDEVAGFPEPVGEPLHLTEVKLFIPEQ